MIEETDLIVVKTKILGTAFSTIHAFDTQAQCFRILCIVNDNSNTIHCVVLQYFTLGTTI